MTIVVSCKQNSCHAQGRKTQAKEHVFAHFFFFKRHPSRLKEFFASHPSRPVLRIAKLQKIALRASFLFFDDPVSVSSLQPHKNTGICTGGSQRPSDTFLFLFFRQVKHASFTRLGAGVRSESVILAGRHTTGRKSAKNSPPRQTSTSVVQGA